ncbi:spore cortex biosynthesis protein YabQ [Oceanobacillus halophilus]|uniref:Spore cortex biosynthesis protein YabQ n=1 Tax=Oceanobacillus halophilus TaxID=930130 RepID=A0A495A1X9_9BACI|nr:spore cortex biosynthesis protein YabQ [Oceanobacillus halophilus]RKQ33035.1 spore cortex biosynthesis protein YabQ [Oceanobacillus halophilus]
MTLSVQFLTMITMIGGGFYLGMILDTFRRFTPYWKNNIPLTYVMEICFWLTQTIILFYILFQVNAGEIRFYIFAACLLGFAMYQVFAASSYKRLLEYIIRMIASVYRFCRRVVQALIIKPITWIITTIFAIVLWILTILWTIIQFIAKLLFAPIRWIVTGIYRILPKSFQRFLHQQAGFYSKIKNIVIKWMKYIKGGSDR